MTRARSIADIGDDVAGGGSLVTTSSPSLGRRNLIINGAMQVAQRGTSFTQNPNTGNYHTVDRFSYRREGTWTNVTAVNLSQETSSPPEGFAYYHRYSTTGNEAATSDAGMSMMHKLERNTTDCLAWGTSNAKQATLSFYVRSSVTGTFSVLLEYLRADSSKVNHVSEYTIDSANTWERKVITINGPATGGSYSDPTAESITFRFYVAGDVTSAYTQPSLNQWDAVSRRWSENQSTLVTSTPGATWDITGIQFEVGSVSTPYEHRSYGEELALCQRYCHVINTGGVNYAHIAIQAGDSSGESFAYIDFPQTMRAFPSLTSSATSTFYLSFFTASGGPNINNSGFHGCTLQFTGSGGTAGKTGRLLSNSTNVAELIFDAEL